MTGIAVGFTIATVAVGPAGPEPNAPGSAAPIVQIFGALLYLGVLVVHLLVIGRYRLLELDLRVRRNVQYLVVSSAWTALDRRRRAVLLVADDAPRTAAAQRPADERRARGAADAGRRRAAGRDREGRADRGGRRCSRTRFRALLKRGHRFLAEQYYQEGYDYRRATKEFSEVMGPRMDLDGLADGLLTVIDRLMPVKRAGVVFVQGDRLVSSKRSIGFDIERLGRVLQRVRGGSRRRCCGRRGARRWTPSTRRRACGSRCGARRSITSTRSAATTSCAA